MNKKRLFLLFILTLIGAILRFYKLDWGQGFFFHPDERNIASAVLNLDPVKGDFNPNFFAYGSFPIYVTYAIGAILSFLTKTNWLEFGKIILIGRIISAGLSTLLIPLVYFVFQQLAINNQQLENKQIESSKFWGLIAAVFAVFTPGLIQYAHFSTFEIILTFEYLLALYFAIKITQRGRWRDYIFCAVVIGASIATKMTSLLVVPILPLAWIIGRMGQMRQIKRILISLLVVALAAFVLSPYNILDFSSFRGTINYEGGVAAGSLPVFYTAQFFETTPFWYQLTQVFPYILGWPLTVLSLLGCLSYLRRKTKALLLLTIPILYFIFHAALFVKWTRYMIPVLPFLVIITVIVLSKWYCFRPKNLSNFQFSIFNFQKFWKVLITILTLTTITSGLSFFSIYLQPDTRIAAAKWAEKNIPRDAKILSEVWDMGLIAFNPYFKNIELVNFYELDTQISTEGKRIITDKNPRIDELVKLLEESEYIIVPSRRIYTTRLKFPERFPLGARYYQNLFNGTLGFTKIAEFDLLSEANAEETFKVFDHPTVIIFKKEKSLRFSDYRAKLE